MIIRQKIVTALLLLLALFGIYSVQAQKSTNSPYSRFGVGEMAPQGSPRNKAMGGVGIALKDNQHLNMINPASYAALDSTSFIFDVGLMANFNQLKSSSEKEVNSQANFEYLAFAFSPKKWWGISVGIKKVTNVGYDLDFNFENKNSGTYSTKYEGNGGVNKVYLSNGFQVTPKLALGLTTIYNWGKIHETKSFTFDDNYTLPFHSDEELKISNINFEFGVQYTVDFQKDKKLTIGGTFGKKTDLTGKYTKFLYRANPSDTISLTKKDHDIFELPNSFGIGVAITNKKLTLAVDANYQAWGSVASLDSQNIGVNVNLKNSYKLALGAEYTPLKYSGRKFFDRLNYRAGLFYNNSNLEINGNQLQEYGITAGLGIPIRNSKLNLAIELGARGTSNNGLIKENYAKLSLSFSIFETWFQKLLYN